MLIIAEKSVKKLICVFFKSESGFCLLKMLKKAVFIFEIKIVKETIHINIWSSQSVGVLYTRIVTEY